MVCRLIYMSEMQSFFRVQSGDRDVNDLLDPAEQRSRLWTSGVRFDDDAHTDRDRDGISVCDSRESLAAYLADAGAGIPYGLPGWVLVELTGDICTARPLDAEHGEYLIRPTRIISCAPIDEEFFELIGAAYDTVNGD